MLRDEKEIIKSRHPQFLVKYIDIYFRPKLHPYFHKKKNVLSTEKGS